MERRDEGGATTSEGAESPVTRISGSAVEDSMLDAGRWRYPIVCACLLVLTTLIVIQQPWVGDFLEHAAVNRELAEHPLSPSHPQIDLDVPHAFFSPYALFWSIVGRLSGLGPIQVVVEIAPEAAAEEEEAPSD